MIAYELGAAPREPMLRNNWVVPDAAERLELAARTVDCWHVVRGMS